MAEFGKFKYGGLGESQKKYLETMKTGMARQQAGAIKKGEQRLASRGMGRSGAGMRQLGDISGAYQEKMAEREAGLRTGAEEKAYQRWFQPEAMRYESATARERAEAGRRFQAGESARERKYGISQAELDRKARLKEIEKSKEKDVWDKIGAIF